MATSDHGAQKPIRAQGSSKCPHHPGKQVVCVCENCQELVCITCVSKLHRGHEFEELADVIPNAKTNIQDFIDKSEKNEIPKIKGKIRHLDSEILQKKKYYQKETSQIEKQNEILIEELNKATRKLVKSYRDMEKQELDILNNHKTFLQAKVDDRSSLIQECKDTLQSGNDVQFYDVSSGLPSEFKDIPTPALPTPSFIPGKFTLQQLEKLVGEVKIRTGRVDLNQPPQQAANYSVVSQFTPYKDHWVHSICPPKGNKVWICLCRINDNVPINKMLLVNHKGEVQQTLDMEVRVVDFCVSPVSGILWFCSLDGNTVREARGGGSVVRFTTDKTPCSICLTDDDHVVIGHQQEVVKYTQTGKVIHKTPEDKPLMIHPYHISQCPNTGHLAAVDLDRQISGGSGHPVVWILDDHLNPLYRYCGDTPGGQPLNQPFDPYDLSFTTNRGLVITDFYNKCVLLVNEKGEYQQTLYTFSDSKPHSVCVHHDGVLWVSFGDGSVQLLKSE